MEATLWSCWGQNWQGWLQNCCHRLIGSKADWHCEGLHNSVSVLTVWYHYALLSPWWFVLCFQVRNCVCGLKDEIRAVVEPQVNTTVDIAAVIANIQRRVLERSKFKYQRTPNQPRHQQHHKDDKLITGLNRQLASCGETGSSNVIEKQMACVIIVGGWGNPNLTTMRFSLKGLNHKWMPWYGNTWTESLMVKCWTELKTHFLNNFVGCPSMQYSALIIITASNSRPSWRTKSCLTYWT